MAESLGKQAQDKALLKMEHMQLKSELMMAQQEIAALKARK